MGSRKRSNLVGPKLMKRVKSRIQAMSMTGACFVFRVSCEKKIKETTAPINVNGVVLKSNTTG
jgi:hypothetical protein